MKRGTLAFALAVLGLACANVSGQKAEPVDAGAPAVQQGGEGKAYTIYVEAMPGKDWDEKIRNAVNRVFETKAGAEIVLPGSTIEIAQPIRLWRQRKTANGKVDTTADGIELGYLPNCYAAIKGGTPADLPRGITLRGARPGRTKLIWKGGPNQVVIDLPAPWYVTVRDLAIDGGNTKGLIGIRYRAGWEFGVNGGKMNDFEHIDMTRLDVGFDIGGPFSPDLVASTFSRIHMAGLRIGFRLHGANVAEMWFKEIMLGSVEEAGFKLIGYPGRMVRRIAEKDTPIQEAVVRDADGREIFMEQIERLPVLMAQQIHTTPHADVPESKTRPWAGGGGPTCYISDLVAHIHDPRAWMVDALYAPVRLEHVRMEGCAGVIRAAPPGSPNSRFADILIDVNAVSVGGLNGSAIEYLRAGPLVMIGGTFAGPIGLGQNAVCHAVGVRFVSEPGKTMHGVLPEGVELPAGCFFKKTGERQMVPYRGLPGEAAQSGSHDKAGFVQLRGTAGAKIYTMPESSPPPAD